jgi:hypothetical protein
MVARAGKETSAADPDQSAHVYFVLRSESGSCEAARSACFRKSKQWPFLETEHAHRTSFAPETTSPKRDNRDRTRTGMQKNQRSRPLSARS